MPRGKMPKIRMAAATSGTKAGHGNLSARSSRSVNTVNSSSFLGGVRTSSLSEEQPLNTPSSKTGKATTLLPNPQRRPSQSSLASGAASAAPSSVVELMAKVVDYQNSSALLLKKGINEGIPPLQRAIKAITRFQEQHTTPSNSNRTTPEPVAQSLFATSPASGGVLPRNETQQFVGSEEKSSSSAPTKAVESLNDWTPQDTALPGVPDVPGRPGVLMDIPELDFSTQKQKTTRTPKHSSKLGEVDGTGGRLLDDAEDLSLRLKLAELYCAEGELIVRANKGNLSVEAERELSKGTVLFTAVLQQQGFIPKHADNVLMQSLNPATSVSLRKSTMMMKTAKSVASMSTSGFTNSSSMSGSRVGIPSFMMSLTEMSVGSAVNFSGRVAGEGVEGDENPEEIEEMPEEEIRALLSNWRKACLLLANKHIATAYKSSSTKEKRNRCRLAIRLLSRCLITLNDYGAQDGSEKGTAKESVILLVALGKAYLIYELFEEALQCAEKALAANPESSDGKQLHELVSKRAHKATFAAAATVVQRAYRVFRAKLLTARLKKQKQAVSILVLAAVAQLSFTANAFPRPSSLQVFLSKRDLYKQLYPQLKKSGVTNLVDLALFSEKRCAAIGLRVAVAKELIYEARAEVRDYDDFKIRAQELGIAVDSKPSGQGEVLQTDNSGSALIPTSEIIPSQPALPPSSNPRRMSGSSNGSSQSRSAPSKKRGALNSALALAQQEQKSGVDFAERRTLLLEAEQQTRQQIWSLMLAELRTMISASPSQLPKGTFCPIESFYLSHLRSVMFLRFRLKEIADRNLLVADWWSQAIALRRKFELKAIILNPDLNEDTDDSLERMTSVFDPSAKGSSRKAAIFDFDDYSLLDPQLERSRLGIAEGSFEKGLARFNEEGDKDISMSGPAQSVDASKLAPRLRLMRRPSTDGKSMNENPNTPSSRALKRVPSGQGGLASPNVRAKAHEAGLPANKDGGDSDDDMNLDI